MLDVREANTDSLLAPPPARIEAKTEHSSSGTCRSTRTQELMKANILLSVASLSRTAIWCLRILQNSSQIIHSLRSKLASLSSEYCWQYYNFISLLS